MRNSTWSQRTVFQMRDPASGGNYQMLLTMEGVSLPIDSGPRLTVDGESWYVYGSRSVAIDTQTRTVVTTITVVRDS